ncbi:unnamed protein product [Ambrosiozyma monospora]|uniref:Unnamed protein product n=1 Tax=Ambrosiozyma monospora TaxID=43982 RepID=A0ACB5TC63_AMBMO|nr:unnamed protein product [Ambrosiozyma monospora]
MNNELHPNLANGTSLLSPPEVPDTFILHKDELLKFETSKISLEQLDQQFVELMKNIQYEQNDTFQFKKQKQSGRRVSGTRFGGVLRDRNSIADPKEEEINELKAELSDMTKNYEKLLDVVGEYREYFKKSRKT